MNRSKRSCPYLAASLSLWLPLLFPFPFASRAFCLFSFFLRFCSALHSGVSSHLGSRRFRHTRQRRGASATEGLLAAADDSIRFLPLFGPIPFLAAVLRLGAAIYTLVRKAFDLLGHEFPKICIRVRRVMAQASLHGSFPFTRPIS